MLELPITPQEITMWALEQAAEKTSFRARYLSSRGRGSGYNSVPVTVALLDFNHWLDMMLHEHHNMCQTRPGYINTRLYIGEVYVMTHDAHHELSK